MGSIQYYRNQCKSIYDKNTTPQWLKNFLSFPKTFPLRIETDVLLYSGLNDRERIDSDYRVETLLLGASFPIIRIKDKSKYLSGAAFPVTGVNTYTK
jgi:hypothetical protein